MKKYFVVLTGAILFNACQNRGQIPVESTPAENTSPLTPVYTKAKSVKIYKNSPPNPAFTSELTVYHAECTACLDVYIDKGDLKVSDKIKKGIRKTDIEGYARSCTNISLITDVLLESDSVFQMLFGKPDDYHFERQYKITGEVVGLRDSCDLILRIYDYKRLKDRKF